MFLLSYRDTCESLGELQKAVETLSHNALIVFSQHFSFSRTCTCVSIKQLDYELELFI